MIKLLGESLIGNSILTQFSNMNYQKDSGDFTWMSITTQSKIASPATGQNDIAMPPGMIH